jgi:hypothetical protein
VLVLATLAACSDDDRTVPAEPPAESPSAFDAATAELTDEPFCEQVDPSLVAGALGVAADNVALLGERVVDPERQGDDDRVRPARVNGCTFGAGSRRLVVAVQPAAGQEAVRRRIDGYRTDGCRVAEDPWFGSPGVVADCERSGGRRTVAVLSAVGGSGFSCTTVVADGPVDRDATVEVCRDTLETLGVPG